MDIRKLQYFISVAQSLNFTKAAKEHYISQTAMSQQIASIESELGVKLFNRSKNKVDITPAGKVFLKEAQLILAQYEQAIKNTKDAMKGVKGSINIGFSGPTEAEALYEIIEKFQEKYPCIELYIESNNFKKLSIDLQDDIYDLIVTLAGEIEASETLDKLTIKKEQAFLAVSKKHPKANNQSIQAKELADEKIIMISEECGQLNFERMVSSCLKDGYMPNIVEKVNSLDTLLLLVELNRGVTILPKSIIRKSIKNIRLIEIKNSHHSFETEMYWKKSNKSEFLEKFISTTKEIYSC